MPGWNPDGQSASNHKLWAVEVTTAFLIASHITAGKSGESEKNWVNSCCSLQHFMTFICLHLGQSGRANCYCPPLTLLHIASELKNTNRKAAILFICHTIFDFSDCFLFVSVQNFETFFLFGLSNLFTTPLGYPKQVTEHILCVFISFGSENGGTAAILSYFLWHFRWRGI